MPKATRAGSLLEEIHANLPVRVRDTFARRLPEDVRVELEAIRDDWRSGRMGAITKTGLGKAISVTLSNRGISAHPLTVTRWLDER